MSDNDEDDGASPSEIELRMRNVVHEEDDPVAVAKPDKKARPKLDKAAGKKPSRPGRFYKNLLPLAKAVDSQRIQSETIVALSRCVDVMADSIAEAFASFAKPIPEDDAGHEPQMLSGVLAFNAIFARIPAGHYHDLCSAAVQKKLDLYWGVDSAEAQ